MRKRATILSVAALGLIWATALPASAQLPKRPAPKGMLEISTGGSGRILTSHMGGTSSARKMLTALKMISGEYFDGPMKVTRAFADADDQNVQAAFTAKLKGVPVRGVAAVKMDGDSGQGTLLFDRATAFTQSFRSLRARQSGGGGAKAAPVHLTRQNALDGSCQISLPPGFRITGSYQGTLDIVGPNGAIMVMGSPVLCTRREAMGLFPGMPGVNFEDPVRALVDMVQYLAHKQGATASVRILDYRPVQDWQTGRAAFVRYSVAIGGKNAEGFGLFSIAPTDVNQALFYQSYVAAPTATFREQLPGMLQAWATYSVSASVLQGRLMAAAESMRGTSDIITSTNANRQQVYARVNEAWDDVIRDQGTWSNPTTGARYKVSNSLTDDGGIPMQNGVPLEPVPLGNL